VGQTDLFNPLIRISPQPARASNGTGWSANAQEKKNWHLVAAGQRTKSLPLKNSYKLKTKPYKLKTNPIQTHCNHNKGQKEQQPLSTNPTSHKNQQPSK